MNREEEGEGDGGRDDNNAVTLALTLKDVFGDSDSEDESHPLSRPSIRCNPPPMTKKQLAQNVWEPVKEINGLWLCRNFLSLQQQNDILYCIQQERWFEEPSKNQVMRFGNLPAWVLKLSGLVQCALCSYGVVCKICNISTSCAHDDENYCHLPVDLLWREPLFDQMIVNAYQPGEGICAHVDLACFEDGIAIISLESVCVMEFTHENDKALPSKKIPVLLNAGDLLFLCGEARYNWLHEINRKPGHQIWDGKEIIQTKRISITLRRLRLSHFQ
ncbi:hypothetical protein SUGI_1048230 [Cryptomeria japonica]|uniref:uncharacterized protein LOC131859473 n=1 Tax=Cryptomeria japonica TaxID=3369 RepID=UPI0024147B4A|nr:uncharacterized protein LOC131859473 [Cryptomeria japonica]GLJ49475.1 hypothetical protein SUGI_1048230 [Cryptomeria japonica]